MASGVSVGVFEVWGSSPTNVFAVGQSGSRAYENTAGSASGNQRGFDAQQFGDSLTNAVLQFSQVDKGLRSRVPGGDHFRRHQ